MARTETTRAAIRRAGGVALVAERLGSGEGRSGYGGALLNVGTAHARKKLDHQLAFFDDEKEAEAVAAELAETVLVKDALPLLPKLQ